MGYLGVIQPTHSTFKTCNFCVSLREPTAIIIILDKIIKFKTQCCPFLQENQDEAISDSCHFGVY